LVSERATRVVDSHRSVMTSKMSIYKRAAIAVGGAWLALCAGTSHAVFFDLRGLNPSQASGYHLTAAGIGVQLSSGGGTSLFVSGATTFGIDSSGPNDIPTLIDGGNGSAEAFSMLFDQDVFFESMLISQFGADDSGSLEIKTATAPLALSNGLNIVSAIAAKGSAHFLRWTGVNAPAAGRGFSVDGFTVRLTGTVPTLAGDYNNNHVVDTGDYVVWRKTLGNSITPFAGADGDGDGTINAGDFAEWRQQFGKGSGSGVEQTTVPEASTSLLFAIGSMVFLASRSRSSFIRFER
jgi:dockerin type I repeat protein